MSVQDVHDILHSPQAVEELRTLCGQVGHVGGGRVPTTLTMPMSLACAEVEMHAACRRG